MGTLNLKTVCDYVHLHPVRAGMLRAAVGRRKCMTNEPRYGLTPHLHLYFHSL